MSCPGGWTESWFKKYGVEFQRIDGTSVGNTINTGSVLDAYGRSLYAISQVADVVRRIQCGDVHDGDVIYTEDFWHPGIESLFYIRQLTGIKFKVGCFLHAQSIDDSDFTYPMRYWMRPIEVGMSSGYDYIFTCSAILRQLAITAGYCSGHLFKSGLPFNSQRLLEQLADVGFEPKPKEEFVLFSSRFDLEKNPHFFLDLVESCREINFKLVKPRKHLTNDQGVLQRLDRMDQSNLEIVDTSSKLAYYDLLARAKVQFNCAKQDWVSWTLLEAITFGCVPLYPAWKDFPVELAGFEDDCIYANEDLSNAKLKIRRLMDKQFDCRLCTIVERHDQSWRQYLTTMNLLG